MANNVTKNDKSIKHEKLSLHGTSSWVRGYYIVKDYSVPKVKIKKK